MIECDLNPGSRVLAVPEKLSANGGRLSFQAGGEGEPAEKDCKQNEGTQFHGRGV
jgi:hypothetical protein